MKATLGLPTTTFVSKIELWCAAYAMARRMIRVDDRHGIGARYSWFLRHARERFGASGWAVAQVAGRLVLEMRTPGHGVSGTLADLARQGLVDAKGQPTRAITVEKLNGWEMAWSADPLVAVNCRRGLRAQQARQLREDRARRRAVARAMAEERAALLAGLESDDRLYVLTEAGRDALREAGMLDG